jgi:hypothetical protein
VDELLWSVTEDRPQREVLIARLEARDYESLIDHEFEQNVRFVADWLCHVRVLYRDEYHEPAEIVETWAPVGVIPLEVLVTPERDDTAGWLLKNRPDAQLARVYEVVGVRKPSEEVRIQMEIMDTDALIIGRGQTYLGEDGEVLLIQHSWLTTDHVLACERNLLWERELESGSQWEEDDR